MYNDWDCTIRIFGWCSWISGTKFYEFPNTWGLRMILIFSNGWFFNPLKRHFNVYTIAESHYSLLLFRVTGINFSLWLCVILHFTALEVPPKILVSVQRFRGTTLPHPSPQIAPTVHFALCQFTRFSKKINPTACQVDLRQPPLPPLWGNRA